jgi:hypothetical protein
MLQRTVGSLTVAVPPTSLLAVIVIDGRGEVGLSVQLEIVSTGIESVHEVKVTVESVPEMLVGLELRVTVAEPVIALQVTVPTPVSVTTDGADEVFTAVVEPVISPPPGSVRSAVDAEAVGTAISARRLQATVVSVRFRMDMGSPWLVKPHRGRAATAVMEPVNSGVPVQYNGQAAEAATWPMSERSSHVTRLT